MNRAIVNPWGNVPTRDSSHSAGWAKLWSLQLGADIVNDWQLYHDYDEFYLFNDINGKTGQFNLFGFKPDNEVGGKIKTKWATLIGLGRPMYNLDYHQTHATEFERRGLGILTQDLYDKLEIRCQRSQLLKTEGEGRMVIGDSHSLSVTRPHQHCLRHDGRTLFAALRDKDIQTAVNVYQPVDLVTYYGNIDVRFHLGQRDNPIADTQELAKSYTFVLEMIAAEYGIRVRAVELLPNAPDDRKIPGTGQLNGQNFYGSLELRKELVNEFNTILRNSNIETVAWNGYSTPDGLLDVNLMEARQSVHIRPSAYNLGY